VSNAIITAWKRGARFDAWTDRFSWDIWKESFRENNIDIDTYLRERCYSEALPWDFVDVGISKEFLWNEYQLGLSGIRREDCRKAGCYNCGVCSY